MNGHRFSMCVAMDLNGAIGRKNELPWKQPGDMRSFVKITKDHWVVICGYSTFASLPRRPLKERINIVLTRHNAKWVHANGGIAVDSFDAALDKAASFSTLACVIGGANVYKQFLPLTTKLHITTVHTRIEGADSFFPKLDLSEWQVVGNEQTIPTLLDARDEYKTTQNVYTRVLR